jgi:hypothetical protein
MFFHSMKGTVHARFTTGSSQGNDVRTSTLPLRLFLVIALKKYYVINQGTTGSTIDLTPAAAKPYFT